MPASRPEPARPAGARRGERSPRIGAPRLTAAAAHGVCVVAALAASAKTCEASGMEPLVRVEELDHVVLRCRDVAQALAFYTGVLGLAEERRIDAIGLVQLRAGRSMLDLVPAEPAPPPPGAGNVDHVCLAIAATDMATLAARLAAAGVEVLGEPAMRYGARGLGPSLYVRDPEGNVVELKAPPAA